MRISQSQVDMSSAHSQSASQFSSASYHSDSMLLTRAALNMEQDTRHIQISEAARKTAEAKVLAQSTQDSTGDPKLDLLKSILEHILGHKINFIKAGTGDGSGEAASATGTADASAGGSASFAASASVTTSESESTEFAAQGLVVTADGQQINFSAELSMTSKHSSTVSIGINQGNNNARLHDPLVINFNGSAAQLSDQRFGFDLLGTGQTNQVNLLKSGSGFLALDANNNGKIDNGKELFGTQSGDGFGDLAKYDSDGNGWIDEGDPVYAKLKVWLKDDSGQDRTLTLADAGIGAIYLGHATTAFDLKDSQNGLAGRIQSTGVYLNQNGSVGTIQHVDLSI